jgi:hypothetical protein
MVGPFRKLLKDRRAVSAVISNMVLIATAIVLGFTVLLYANFTSNSYATKYGQTVSSDINQLGEQVSFEYCFYNVTGFNATAGSLTAYFMNSGNVNGINATMFFVSNSSWTSTSFRAATLKYLNGTATASLKVNEEGYVVLSPITLVRGSSYEIRIVTWRQSAFEYCFVP